MIFEYRRMPEIHFRSKRWISGIFWPKIWCYVSLELWIFCASTFLSRNHVFVTAQTVTNHFADLSRVSIVIGLTVLRPKICDLRKSLDTEDGFVIQ